jgi:diacylglycerol kinase family enzyme
VSGPRDFLLLVNERAGAAHGQAAVRRAEGALAAAGGRTRMARCAAFGEARDALRGLSPEEIPVAVGGDGTVNLMVGALRAEGMGQRPFGVLPAGTGNAFAHSLGIRDTEQALWTLRNGSATPLDVLATGHPDAPVALVSLSAGFEARFLRQLAARRAPWRLWSAGVALALSAGRRCSGVRMTANGAELLAPGESFYSAGFYNMPRYAFGREVVPEADPRDGEAHAVVYEVPGAYWRTLGRGRGEAAAPRVRQRRFRQARIESAEPLQVDGESVCAGNFDVRVEPAAIRVLAP